MAWEAVERRNRRLVGAMLASRAESSTSGRALIRDTGRAKEADGARVWVTLLLHRKIERERQHARAQQLGRCLPITWLHQDNGLATNAFAWGYTAFALAVRARILRERAWAWLAVHQAFGACQPETGWRWKLVVCSRQGHDRGRCGRRIPFKQCGVPEEGRTSVCDQPSSEVGGDIVSNECAVRKVELAISEIEVDATTLPRMVAQHRTAGQRDLPSLAASKEADRCSQATAIATEVEAIRLQRRILRTPPRTTA